MDKGISPLVASILLLAFTMTIAALAGPFFSNTFEGATDSSQEKAERAVDSTNYNLEVQDVSYNPIEDKIRLVVRNTGESVKGNVTNTIECSEGGVVQKRFNNIKSGGIRSVEIDVNNCNPSKGEISLTDYAVSTSISRIRTTENPSWIQSTEDDFKSFTQSTNNIYYDPIRISQFESSDSETSGFSGQKTNITESGGGLRLE